MELEYFSCLGYNQRMPITSTHLPEPLMKVPYSSLYNTSRQNSHHHTGTNLSTRTNSTSVYYCEICRIACRGQSSYQAHLNGLKHKKRKTESNIHKQQINENIFRCELSDITCTSSDAYKAHLNGDKHDKVVLILFSFTFIITMFIFLRL